MTGVGAQMTAILFNKNVYIGGRKVQISQNSVHVDLYKGASINHVNSFCIFATSLQAPPSWTISLNKAHAVIWSPPPFHVHMVYG